MAPRNDLATTWWSKQWIAALETRALRDPNRLARGRTYARKGTVHQLDITEGHITADVTGSRSRPYKVTIGVRQFRPDEWDALFEVIGSQVGFTADLLAGLVPRQLVADAARRGVELLPVAGDLEMTCSCPDWAVPCKHLAAVCYVIASALDTDPFEILRLRGRSRHDVEERLRAERSSAAAPEADGRFAADLAASMWAGPDTTIDTALFSTIGRVSEISNESIPQRWATIRADREGQLVADVLDAATRADRCLAEGASAKGGSDLLADAARRASFLAPGSPERTSLARRCEITPAQLEALAVSWRNAGERGVAVANQRRASGPAAWPPIDPTFAAVASQVLRDAGVKTRVASGWLTVVGSGIRIVTDSDHTAWIAIRRQGRSWVALGQALLEDIADLIPNEPSR